MNKASLFFPLIAVASSLGVAAFAHANEQAVASNPSVAEVGQAPVSPRTVVVNYERPSRVVIGQETSKLLAMQRSVAAQRARPIDGEQATRSYARYLKSFEHPIPEAFETGTDIKK